MKTKRYRWVLEIRAKEYERFVDFSRICGYNIIHRELRIDPDKRLFVLHVGGGELKLKVSDSDVGLFKMIFIRDFNKFLDLHVR